MRRSSVFRYCDTNGSIQWFSCNTIPQALIETMATIISTARSNFAFTPLTGHLMPNSIRKLDILTNSHSERSLGYCGRKMEKQAKKWEKKLTDLPLALSQTATRRNARSEKLIRNEHIWFQVGFTEFLFTTLVFSFAQSTETPKISISTNGDAVCWFG